MSVKQLIYIATTLLCLGACQDKVESFVLQGNVSDLHNDTLLIYGADDLFAHVDTIVTKGSRFEYHYIADTITPLWVHFPNQYRELIFADKQLTVTLKGDSAATHSLSIQGGAQNALLQQFVQQTAQLTPEDITLKADTFIREHPYDQVSIYLLRKYFVEVAEPDYPAIRSLIQSLSGLLQDNVYIRSVQYFLDKQHPLGTQNVISDYSGKGINGKDIYFNHYKDTYLLITFWASWDAESRERQRALIPIKERYSNYQFDILSISLDTHIDSCRQAVQADSTTWAQICDGKGWNNSIVQHLKVYQLPYNILVNPYRRIQAINISDKELEQFIQDKVKLKEPKKKYHQKKFKR